MMRVTSRVGTALLLLALPALALATVTFERRWHWYSEDVGRSVALTADGGYLVSGQTWAGSSQYGIVLARTDSSGDTTSVQHLPDVSNGSGYLCQLRGGDFVAAGIRNSGHVFARGIDPSGDSIWSYDSPQRGLVFALTATSDGGCLIAGRDSSLDMGLIRLDSAGYEVWSHSYDDPHVQATTAYGVAETRDSGFILCGDVIDYLESYVRLVRTDAAGETLWTHLYSGPVGPSLQAVRETPDGGCLSVGLEFDTLSAQNALYLLRTDPNGAVIWTRDISLPGAGTQATALCATRDSGYVVAGSIDWGDSARAFLVKLDANADTVWTSVLPGSGKEQARDVWQTADGGYVIAGTSDAPGDSILLVKTDSLGRVQTGLAEGGPAAGERIAFSVAPNPASDFATLSFTTPVERSSARALNLSIYDATGRLAHSTPGLRASPFRLDLRSLPAGVYMLKLEYDGRTATRKLIIE